MRHPLLSAVTLLAAPEAAHAHLVTSGLGPFYDGALHLLLSPADLLGVVVLALLAGQHGAAAGRLTVLVLPVAWLLAGVVGLALPAALDLPWLSVLSYMLLGVLLAANLKLPPSVVAALAGLYGSLHGLLNGSTLAAVGAGWPGLIGIVVTALLLALLLSAAVVPIRADWGRIAIRVVGSWVAAVGLLMFGWLLQGAS
jgi:hydrogenase/urease accessory protein HupE